MIIDLRHNKIVADVITEGFERSVKKVLLPLLSEKYGDGLIGIQMYEDYISDKLSFDGEWYYPFTVNTLGGIDTAWVKWRVDKKNFADSIPYAYVGAGEVAFSLCDSVPSAFEEKISGRARYCEEGLVKIKIETTATDPTFLSGRYSQTFVDEMARQLTSVIEREMAVSGIADSSISLLLVFAPGSYMEHTSENATYRRLLLTDKTSAPRDFWVKWTRLDGEGAYTVADAPASCAIVFEMGDGVSQKIRETEYRFLLTGGKDDYHRAMGRKNLGEWKTIVKRAIRRGELVKTEEETLSASFVAELEMKSEPLAITVESTPTATEETFIKFAEEEDDDFARAMRLAREVVGIADESESKEEADESDDEAALDEITRMAMEALRGAAAEYSEPDDEEPTVELEEEIEESESEIEADEDELEEIEETDELDELDEIDEILDEEELSDEEIEQSASDALALEPDEEDGPVEQPSEISREDLEEKLRKEIEASLRIEYEARARQRAEEEAARLRKEQEELRLELQRLQNAAKLAEAEREKELEAERSKQDDLRARIEQQMRAEAKERERLAEAAMLAVEENRRLEEERARIERDRLEAERIAKEERERAELARAAEAERLAREARAAAPAEDSTVYVSKLVKLRFRRSVDPAVTNRIYEIIKATLEYYGKENVNMRIRASLPDSETVNLDFVKIPKDEMELLSNIIKVLGNSGLGIAKAVVE